MRPQAGSRPPNSPPSPSAAVADHLETAAEAHPQKAKALLRLLIDELRVNSLLPTNRLVTPEV